MATTRTAKKPPKPAPKPRQRDHEREEKSRSTKAMLVRLTDDEREELEAFREAIGAETMRAAILAAVRAAGAVHDGKGARGATGVLRRPPEREKPGPKPADES